MRFVVRRVKMNFKNYYQREKSITKLLNAVKDLTPVVPYIGIVGHGYGFVFDVSNIINGGNRINELTFAFALDEALTKIHKSAGEDEFYIGLVVPDNIRPYTYIDIRNNQKVIEGTEWASKEIFRIVVRSNIIPSSESIIKSSDSQ